MKLGPGKIYRTRDGRQAFVGAVDEQRAPDEVAIGWIDMNCHSWTIEGFYTADLLPNALDLIAETN